MVVRDLGYLSKPSWLKKANRTFRWFINEERISPELKERVLFILKLNMPMWFAIKTSNHFTGGSKRVYQVIQYTRYLSKPLLISSKPVIERNGFFPHTEHLMLAISQDDKKSTTEFGLKK